MDIELLGNIKSPNVLIIGVFHGDEPQGNFLIREYFKQNPNTNLLLLPCLNSYGMKYFKRTNINGVDLNRNFPTKNWFASEKNDYYGGNSPASEAETQFLISVIKKYKPSAIISLHAPYKIVNFDGNSEIYDKTRILAEKISEIINYPVQENIGYPTPGSFGTWAGIEQKISTITLELDENCEVAELVEPIFKIFKMLESY
ncbi:MAG: DUF2817 domain-containing protein [bacterium]|nr:DUF2817 domain-containing protein [bacterium]